MIQYNKYTLDNGLTFIHHHNPDSPMAALFLLINAGSRNDPPGYRGLAHLFEHLMYTGTRKFPDYDQVLQMAGGDGNAMTNQDITAFYASLPYQNIESLLQLEADRMTNLKLTKKGLEIQKKVVIEEYRESCIDDPFGNSLGIILQNQYHREHPYSWPTIGSSIDELKQIDQSIVDRFYQDHYTPGNTILSISSPYTEAEILNLVEKHFAKLASRAAPDFHFPTVNGKLPDSSHLDQYVELPLGSLMITFPMSNRLSGQYLPAQILADVLGNNYSSKFYLDLVKRRQLATDVDCYTTGFLGPGLFIIEAEPVEGVDLTDLSNAIWEHLDRYQSQEIEDKDLMKIKNQRESALVYGQLNAMQKASTLAMYEWLDTPERMSQEYQRMMKINARDILEAATSIFNHKKCFELRYHPASV